MPYPPQGKLIGKKVLVCFDYDTSTLTPGVFVRDDDTVEQGRRIIALDDGRYVLTTECQWSYAPATTEPSKEH